MFGGPVPCPKLPKKKCKHEDPDILMPTAHYVGVYAHRGREPNTDYDKRLLFYKQRSEELRFKKDEAHERSLAMEFTNILHQNMAEKRRFRSKIQQRLNDKLAAYEVEVEKRREKLRNLLAEDEMELIRDTVDKLQNADVNRIEDRRKQCEAIRAQKEAQRLELVRQKRFQQYAARSQELRPFVAKKRLEESKNSQLQQIRENEFRREAERELDKLWYNVMKKQEDAKLERETQEALLKHDEFLKDKAILDMQVRAKKILEEDQRAIEHSNREEMQRLMERIAQQEAEDLRLSREKAKKTAEEVKKQLQLQKEFEERRKKEEYALDQAFKELTDIEVAKEAAKVDDRAAKFRRETVMYKEHLEQMKKLRADEEAKLDQLLQEVRNEDQRKRDEQKCQFEQARQKLQKDVLEGRAKQVEERKKQAEKNLQHQRDENEAIRKVMEQNRVLDAEAKRLEQQAAKQYRDDLRKQIQYNNLLREREMKDMEEKLRRGVEQELEYEKQIQDLFNTKTVAILHNKHPFRTVVERFDCHCPENTKLQK